jgi:hypothetical protein
VGLLVAGGPAQRALLPVSKHGGAIPPRHPVGPMNVWPVLAPSVLNAGVDASVVHLLRQLP